MQVKKYSANWICKRCNRSFRLHLKIGTFSKEEGVIAIHDWCFPRKEVEGDIRLGWYFVPVSNLEYLEYKSKNENIE